MIYKLLRHSRIQVSEFVHKTKHLEYIGDRGVIRLLVMLNKPSFTFARPAEVVSIKEFPITRLNKRNITRITALVLTNSV